MRLLLTVTCYSVTATTGFDSWELAEKAKTRALASGATYATIHQGK